jgi:hypothetical protein
LCRCGGWLGAALRLPSRCGRTLLCPRPRSAFGAGAPRCPQETASPTPQPRCARPVPATSGGMAAGTRRADCSPQRERIRFLGGGSNPPVPRVADLSGARGHPACASASGDAGPERSVGNSEGHGAEAHCGVAGTGVCGRSGWRDARPHPATRGTGTKEEPSRSDKERRALHRAGKRRPPRQWKKEARVCGQPPGSRGAPRARRRAFRRVREPPRAVRRWPAPGRVGTGATASSRSPRARAPA